MTNDIPQFSIIIPTYNRAHTIHRAIHSVLCQTYTDFEVIIADDGSTDNTQKIIEQFVDSRVHYVKQQNRGVSSARNLGFGIASGRYITFLDSDDEVMPDWLSHFINAFNNSNVGAACCGMKILSSEQSMLGRFKFPKDLGPSFNHHKGLFQAGTFVLPAEVFRSIDGYTEELTFSENTELSLRLIPYLEKQNKEIFCINKPLLIYHYQSFSGSKSPSNLKRNLKNSEYILYHHGTQLRKDPFMYGNYLATAGVRSARLSDYIKARRFFQSAIIACPWNWRHYVRFILSLLWPLGQIFWLRFAAFSKDQE